MKIIAYFLPQFHEIPENNLWWGEGFTEWTNVKSSKNYYKFQNNPQIPLNYNYYNLLDINTLIWQAELAQQYGIYGFCYYHYWFNGRKILEKPAELLLANKNIKQNICFCWANHTWNKSWKGSTEVLISQTYGDQEEWEEHINYLMEFFKDSRYIKKDNKPILMLYDAKSIPNIDERIEYYNNKCIQQGFDGIYIIESINDHSLNAVSNLSNAVTLREPAVSISTMSKLNKLIYRIKVNKRNKFLKPHVYDFMSIMDISTKFSKNFKSNKTIMLGTYTGWDSTPRHKNRGYIIKNSTPINFQEYLLKQKQIIKDQNFDEIIFINAWNEWAEGMILEPTLENGYNYLKCIKNVVNKG